MFMFMKKKLFKVLVPAMLLCVASAFSAKAITCSAGDEGRCFGYVESNTTIPFIYCEWTGRERDNCTSVGRIIRNVKIWI